MSEPRSLWYNWSPRLRVESAGHALSSIWPMLIEGIKGGLGTLKLKA